MCVLGGGTAGQGAAVRTRWGLHSGLAGLWREGGRCCPRVVLRLHQHLGVNQPCLNNLYIIYTEKHITCFFSFVSFSAQALSDLCSRSHQVLMLPLLALCRAWQEQLAGQAPARPLVILMSSLCDRLQGQWVAFVNAQAASIEQYEGRSKMGLQQGKPGQLMAVRSILF